MIAIKTLTWDNWFSYGEGNILEITDAKVVQITGKNGTGKSSIPVILGEVLTGKNAFGKTKQKLFNRYLDKPAIKATITLDKDGVEYVIDYNRKTTLKLTLLEDGVDISSHSSTNTLKTINNILGFDFKLLWQLIYQSSTEGLDFLTDTDTARKKFLINLFSLDKYLEIHEQFKRVSREINNELLGLSGKLTTTQGWIEKNNKVDLNVKTVEPVPSVEKEDIDKLTNLKAQLNNLADTNKKINNNNQYKKLLANLDTSILSENINMPDANMKELIEVKRQLQSEVAINASEITKYSSSIKKLESLTGTCFTCEQEINNTIKEELINELNGQISIAQELIIEHNLGIEHIDKTLVDINRAQKRLNEKASVEAELQELLSKIDKTLPEEIVDEEDLKERIVSLTNIITNVNASIKVITSRNMEAEAHNSKVKVIKEQLQEYKLQLNALQKEVDDKTFYNEKVNVIKKAFSTNGLLNFKIEFLVKDLEHQINTYLEDLSNGRFQLLFSLNGEKLDIDIIDDGKTIGIEELSAGELARITTSTLLAIRKLMAAISSTKINILFLDEIMGVLDEEGKEKLIDILNAETELNTFLVSHDFSHPLIPTINIVKENKISRIE